MEQSTNIDASSIPGIGALIGIMAGMVVFFIILGIAYYVFQGFVYSRIYRKAGVKYPWMAWIPVANAVPFFWTIKKSAWNMVWLFVPSIAAWTLVPLLGKPGLIITLLLDIVVVVFAFIWLVRFLKAFKINPHWLWFALGLWIPGLNLLIMIAFIVLECLIAFNSNIKYNPNFDRKGPDDSGVTL